MKLKEFLAEAKAFHIHHKPVAVMVWLFACIASTAFAFPYFADNVDFIVLGTPTLAGFVFHALIRYNNALESRINAGGDGPEWLVQVNGVTVGQINDSDHAAIRRTVFLDARTYAAQLLNLGNVAIRAVDYLFLAIPLSAFWLVIGCFFFSPETFSEAAWALQNMTTPQAVSAVPILLRILAMVSIMVIVFHVVFGRGFGFVNRFEQECSARVRRFVECPAEGNVSLCRFVDAALIVHNEMDCIKAAKQI